MKKLLAVLLVTAICCLTMASCATKTKKYTESQELQMVLSYTYDNSCVAVVKNNTSDAILDFLVAYIEYDANGKKVTTNKMGCDVGQISNANVQPGEEFVASFGSSGGVYTKAVVYGLTYSDGTHWALKNLKNWIAYSDSNFTKDDYTNTVAGFAIIAAEAAKMDYANLTIARPKAGTSGRDGLDVTVYNKTVYKITEFKMIVLEFDANGKPVQVQSQAYRLNARYAGGSISLDSGKTQTFSTSDFFEPTCAKYKLIVTNIVFEGGTQKWTNSHSFEWVAYNCDGYRE